MPFRTDARPSPVLTGQGDSLVDPTEYGDIFLSLVDRTGVGLVILDLQLRIQETNPAFLELCGRPSFDLRRRELAELLHPSVRQNLRRQFEKLLHGHKDRFVDRLAALWAGHTTSVCSLTGMAVRDNADQFKAIVVLVTADTAEEPRRSLVGRSKILTSMDARILEGVATGETTVQLAARLFLSRQGIEYHVSNMLRQFKVPNRASLASKAYSMGYFAVGVWPPKVLPEFVHRRTDRD